MKKHYSLPLLPSLLAYAFIIVSFQCHAETPTPTSTLSPTNQKNLQSIDSEIESLQKQLAQLRRKMLNSEIHAQTYMIDDWHKFAEDISHTEDSEKEILTIKKKIKELEDQKKLLIQIQDHPSK